MNVRYELCPFQLEELEKIFNEGQVFTEFQKVERRSEVSERNTVDDNFPSLLQTLNQNIYP